MPSSAAVCALEMSCSEVAGATPGNAAAPKPAEGIEAEDAHAPVMSPCAATNSGSNSPGPQYPVPYTSGARAIVRNAAATSGWYELSVSGRMRACTRRRSRLQYRVCSAGVWSMTVRSIGAASGGASVISTPSTRSLSATIL